MSRMITRPVADIIEQLELDGDTIVTVDRLASVMDEVGATVGWAHSVHGARGSSSPVLAPAPVPPVTVSWSSGPNTRSERGGPAFSRWNRRPVCSRVFH
jgi:hypothetical protein